MSQPGKPRLAPKVAPPPPGKNYMKEADQAKKTPSKTPNKRLSK